MPAKVTYSGVLSKKTAFLIVVILSFILLPLLSLNAGISGDEPVHYKHAELVHKYYATNGADSSAINTPVTNLQYYGQVFDNLSYAVNQLVHSAHPYQVRHLMNALAGALLMLFTALIALQLGGYPAAFLAYAFMFFSPRILGHSYNNLKDIPFALGYIITIWGLIHSIRIYPKKKIQYLGGMALGFGLAFGTRAGGLLLIPIILFFGSVGWIEMNLKQLSSKRTLIRGSLFIGFLMLSVIGGYVAGILYWPYAMLDPIAHPFESLKLMTHYSVSIRTVFEGQWYWSENLPWYYGIKWISMTTPLVILLGFGIFFFTKPKKLYSFAALLVFCALFPVFWTIINNANLYGGWRHLIFIYPPVVIISALGWQRMHEVLKNRIFRMALIVVILIGLIGPVIHTVKNHPLEYVYFNVLSGGVDKQPGQFETDYYFHAVRECLEWLDGQVKQEQGPISVASNFPLSEYSEYHSAEFDFNYVNYYQRGKFDWDYGIFSSTNIDPEQLANNQWPTDLPVYEVRVNNTVVCVLIERKSRNDLHALKAYRSWDFVAADSLYVLHLEQNNNDETSLLYRGWTQRHLQNWNTSDSLARQLLKIHPNSDNAKNLIAKNAMDQHRFESAEKAYLSILDQNYKFLPAYSGLSEAYDSLGQPKKSLFFLRKGFELGMQDSLTISQLISGYQASGNTSQANKFRTILNK